MHLKETICLSILFIWMNDGVKEAATRQQSLREDVQQKSQKDQMVVSW